MKASFATKITSTERGTTDRLLYFWASTRASPKKVRGKTGEDLRAIASCTPLPLRRPSACPAHPPVRPCVPIPTSAPPPKCVPHSSTHPPVRARPRRRAARACPSSPPRRPVRYPDPSSPTSCISRLSMRCRFRSIPNRTGTRACPYDLTSRLCAAGRPSSLLRLPSYRFGRARGHCPYTLLAFEGYRQLYPFCAFCAFCG